MGVDQWEVSQTPQSKLLSCCYILSENRVSFPVCNYAFIHIVFPRYLFLFLDYILPEGKDSAYLVHHDQPNDKHSAWHMVHDYLLSE